MADSSSFDLCRVLLFGHRADRAEVHTLRAGVWQSEVAEITPDPESGTESRLVAIEVDSASDLRDYLEERLADLQENGFRSCYLLLPDRRGADLVSQMLLERSLGPFVLYGIDPDYYHGMVPLTGENHRHIESFVLSLKPVNNFTTRLKYWVKLALIRADLSTRLYERFVIVLRGSSC